MFASSNARDGVNPNWVPSIRKMAELLEIPGDEYEKIFWPAAEQNDKTEDTDNNVDGNGEADDELDKQQTISQRNKDALQRKERTRRDRRARERLEDK